MKFHLYLTISTPISGSHTKYTRSHTLSIHTHTYTPMINLQPCTCVYIRVCIHTHIHVLTPTHVSAHMYIYIPKAAYSHTSVNSIIHIQYIDNYFVFITCFYANYYYGFHFMRIFHTTSHLWLFTENSEVASLLMSPEVFKYYSLV